MTIAVPVKVTAHDIRGVLTAEISLKTLWTPISSVRVGQSGYVFAVDQHGRLIAHPDYSKVLIGADMSAHPAVARFLSGPSRPLELGEVDGVALGQATLATYAVVQPPGWAVVVEENADTALAGVRRVERLGLGLLLMTVAGAFAMSYWFSGRIARPILEVLAARVAEALVPVAS